MKVLQLTRTDDQMQADDWNQKVQILVDGKTRISAQDYGEPEDNTLGRDKNFVFQIFPLLKEIADAKDRGEEVTFESRKFTDEENAAWW